MLRISTIGVADVAEAGPGAWGIAGAVAPIVSELGCAGGSLLMVMSRSSSRATADDRVEADRGDQHEPDDDVLDR
jgi:hypothetical protein